LPQDWSPVVAVPWTRRTGGAAAVGLPPGQVNAAARVSAATEKGASPAKTYEGAALLTGAAAAMVMRREVASERILNERFGLERVVSWNEGMG
jgi:hypothetical protein